MSSRREQKENLRRERERREAEAKAAAQRKRLFGVVGAVAIAVVAVVIVVVVAGGGSEGGTTERSAGNNFPTGGSVPKQKEFDLQKAASAAGCELKTSPSAGARDHTADPSEKVQYKDNPPTNGRHYQIPADDGLYNGAPPKDTALVHELEHGRVIIWAKPSLPAEARKELRALFDEDTYQMVVVRRPNMPYAVAATAWNRDPTPNGTGRTLGCTKWDENVIDALRTFRDEHRSNGPEDIP